MRRRFYAAQRLVLGSGSVPGGTARFESSTGFLGPLHFGRTTWQSSLTARRALGLAGIRWAGHEREERNDAAQCGFLPTQRLDRDPAACAVLWRHAPDVGAHREEEGKRRRLHDRRQQAGLRHLGRQHDGDVDLGVVDVRLGDVRLHLRYFRADPLRSLGCVDDPVHLPLWPADPRGGTEGPHAGGSDVRPPRPFQPADAGRLQRGGQPDQPDLQLHRRWRAGGAALPVQLRPGRHRRGSRRAALHPVVRFPRLGADRLRPSARHAGRRRRDHSCGVLCRGRAGDV